MWIICGRCKISKESLERAGLYKEPKYQPYWKPRLKVALIFRAIESGCFDWLAIITAAIGDD